MAVEDGSPPPPPPPSSSSSSMPPLIDLGDENELSNGARFGHENGSQALAFHTFAAESSSSPAPLYSTPFAATSDEHHTPNPWFPEFDRQPLSSSEASHINAGSHVFDLLSDFSVSFSPPSTAGSTRAMVTSQDDLLSRVEWNDWRSTSCSFESPELASNFKNSQDFLWPFEDNTVGESCIARKTSSGNKQSNALLEQHCSTYNKNAFSDSYSLDEISSKEKAFGADIPISTDITNSSSKNDDTSVAWSTNYEDNSSNSCSLEETHDISDRSLPGTSSSSSRKQFQNTKSAVSPTKAEEIPSAYLKFDGREEFVGAGGGKGTFRSPLRGAVHMERPLSFELRPRPLKRMESSQTVGVLACIENRVWASCDSGIMVWDIESAYEGNSDIRDNGIEDDDAASFTLLPLHGSAVSSLAPDIPNNICWSGHGDGKLMAWPLNLSHGNKMAQVGPILTWQGHQTPIMAMIITPYGELWTGSENGSIRAWPSEIVTELLSSKGRARYKATSYIAGSYIDLRSRGMISGSSTLSNTDVKFLVAEHSTGRVWSGGSYLLALWDARTRAILKVFGPNAQAEFSSPDVSPVRENVSEADTNLNMATFSKREKAQKSLNFFQRSRNAVIGAADAVLRVTIGSQSWDDSKRIEALSAASDGKVWAGYANGMLVQWDNSGNRLKEEHYISVAVRCMCSFGTRLWIGYADGSVHVLDITTGRFLGGWHAHKTAVMQIGMSNSHIFTFASHGGLRGWIRASPSALDQTLKSEMCLRESSFTKYKKLKVLAGTWNVSQERASYESLKLWLAKQAVKANIVVIGLQEMEMGASALAMAAAKETVGLEGSAQGQWWLENIGNAIGGQRSFERVASRQLAGLLIGAWVSKNILPHVGEVYVGAVACGFGRAFGNKGAVAVKMSVFRRTICVVNCHFAAHIDAVARRNDDFDHVYHRMAFGRSLTGSSVAASAMAAGVSSAVQMIRGTNVQKSIIMAPDVHQDGYMENDSPTNVMGAEATMETVMPELSEADMLIWIGDFNYRLDGISYDDTIDLISHESWEVLLGKDQLRREMKAGRVFQGMREGPISFPPTYKFDKPIHGLDSYPPGYDSSEKRRVPAWCDRILYRDSFINNESMQQISLAHPVLASIARYAACMDVLDSDHKPVCSMFHVQLASIDEAARREAYGNIMKTNKQAQQSIKKNNSIPEVILDSQYLYLEEYNKTLLRITNRNNLEPAIFRICYGGESSRKNHNILMENACFRACHGFPRWLQVIPAAGVIGPMQTVKISFNYSKVLENETIDTQQNQFFEKEKVVVVLHITGSLSSLSRQHKIFLQSGLK